MRAAIRGSIVLVLAVLLSACTNGLLTTKDPAQRVLVYGYFDMSQANNHVKHVMLDSNQPMTVGSRWGLYKLRDNQYFAAADLQPGYTYTVKGIVGPQESYAFGPDFDEAFIIDARPGEMVYVGAWRYVPHQRTGRDVLANTGSFSLEPIGDMSEAEVLRLVRESVRDAHWAARIDDRLTRIARH